MENEFEINVQDFIRSRIIENLPNQNENNELHNENLYNDQTFLLENIINFLQIKK